MSTSINFLDASTPPNTPAAPPKVLRDLTSRVDRAAKTSSWLWLHPIQSLQNAYENFFCNIRENPFFDVSEDDEREQSAFEEDLKRFVAVAPIQRNGDPDGAIGKDQNTDAIRDIVPSNFTRTLSVPLNLNTTTGRALAIIGMLTPEIAKKTSYTQEQVFLGFQALYSAALETIAADFSVDRTTAHELALVGVSQAAAAFAEKPIEWCIMPGSQIREEQSTALNILENLQGSEPSSFLGRSFSLLGRGASTLVSGIFKTAAVAFPELLKMRKHPVLTFLLLAALTSPILNANAAASNQIEKGVVPYTNTENLYGFCPLRTTVYDVVPYTTTENLYSAVENDFVPYPSKGNFYNVFQPSVDIEAATYGALPYTNPIPLNGTHNNRSSVSPLVNSTSSLESPFLPFLTNSPASPNEICSPVDPLAYPMCPPNDSPSSLLSAFHAFQWGVDIAKSHPFLTMAALVARSVLTRIVASPGINASASSPIEKITRSVVTKQGTWQIEMEIASGLTTAQKDQTIELFKKRCLEQVPLSLSVSKGETLEWVINDDSYTISRRLITAAEQQKYEGRPQSELKKEIRYSSELIGEMSLLREIIVQKAKAPTIFAKLESVFQNNAISLTQPAFIPPSFTNSHSDPAFNAAVISLLSIPEVRSRMAASNLPSLRDIAVQSTISGSAIDLAPLRKALTPRFFFRRKGLMDGRKHDAEEYVQAIFRLMKQHDPVQYDPAWETLSQFYTPRIAIPSSITDDEDITHRWEEAESIFAPYPIVITPPPSLANASLQILFDDYLEKGNQSLKPENNPWPPDKTGNRVTQFSRIPEFLRIHLEGNERDVPLTLTLAPKHVQPNVRPVSTPFALVSFSNEKGRFWRTVERINGRDEIFYFEYVDGTPQIISQKMFEAQAKKGKDFSYHCCTSKVPPVAVRSTMNSVIKEMDITPPIPFLPTPTHLSFERGEREEQSPSLVANNAQVLQTEVESYLNIQKGLNEREVAIPVPKGSGPDGENWPLGIIWYAVKEYITKNPGAFDRIKVITDADYDTMPMNDLMKRIDKVEEFLTRTKADPNPPQAFYNLWIPFSKT